MATNKQKRILKFDLIIFSEIQIYLKYAKVSKSLDPTVQGVGEFCICTLSKYNKIVIAIVCLFFIFRGLSN
jgi:hypothetical protein